MLRLSSRPYTQSVVLPRRALWLVRLIAVLYAGAIVWFLPPVLGLAGKSVAYVFALIGGAVALLLVFLPRGCRLFLAGGICRCLGEKPWKDVAFETAQSYYAAQKLFSADEKYQP